MKRIPILLTIALSAALLLTATQSMMTQLPTEPNLVYFRITAIEPERNRPIRGLSKEQFKVVEDGAHQEIVHFSEEMLPLRVGVLLDLAGSTKDDLLRYVTGLTKPGTGADHYILLEPGKAPLNDAILQALNELDQGGNQEKRALLLFTSKKEPSAYPLEKIRARLKELDIPLYVTSIQTGSNLASDSDRQVVKELTEQTGGSAYFPSAPFQQADILKQIVAQLKNQYLIGYRPTNRATDGKWRKVRITAEYLDTQKKKVKKADVLAKAGYYAVAAVK